MNFKKFETAQKLLGSYYTQPDIADYLSRWVLECKPQRILEPACGNGAFIRSILSLRPTGLKEIVGCEIDPAEAKSAGAIGDRTKGAIVSVHAGDFLEWSLSRFDAPPEFDGVVGNPPFIRYQYLDAKLQARSEKIFSRFGLPFTKHTNAWVPFIIASIAHLRAGGRLAMVVPSELLHVIHAKPLRDFLLANCSTLLVLDPQDIWFNETLQGIVLLFAEKARGESVAQIAVKTVRSREELNGSAQKHFESAHYTSGSLMNGKWMLSLLSAREQTLLRGLAKHPNIRRFKQIASVDVGIVTGANKFFLVADSVVKEFDLEEWAMPMFGRSDHVQGVIYDIANHRDNRSRALPTNFIAFPRVPMSELPAGARRYIRFGEAQGLHTRFKCRMRSPWYSVPSVYTAPVGMLKRAHHFPRLILNRAEAYTTDTAYRLTSDAIKPDALVAGFVNSLTALMAELEGRHYGGGVLELVPSEIEKLLLPVAPVGRNELAALNELVKGDAPPEIVLTKQDAAILMPLGIKRRECDELHAAWARLRDRRHRTPAISEIDSD